MCAVAAEGEGVCVVLGLGSWVGDRGYVCISRTRVILYLQRPAGQHEQPGALAAAIGESSVI